MEDDEEKPTEAEGNPGQELENAQGEASRAQGSSGAGTEQFDEARALETIRQQRANERRLETELKELRKRVRAIDAADAEKQKAEMTELERTKSERAELEAKLANATALVQGLRLQREFGSAAAKLKLEFSSTQAAEDAFELADMDGVEIAADGKVTGLDAVLKALQKDRPYLFKAENSTSSQGTPKREQQQRNFTPASSESGNEPPRPLVSF